MLWHTIIAGSCAGMCAGVPSLPAFAPACGLEYHHCLELRRHVAWNTIVAGKPTGRVAGNTVQLSGWRWADQPRFVLNTPVDGPLSGVGHVVKKERHDSMRSLPTTAKLISML